MTDLATTLKGIATEAASALTAVSGVLNPILTALPIESGEKAAIQAVLNTAEQAAANITNMAASAAINVTISRADVDAAVAAYLAANGYPAKSA